MKYTKIAFMVLAAVLVATTWATAQEAPPPPPPVSPGGPGGPGMGMMGIGEVAEDAWKLQAEFVAAQLTLTPEESTKLEETYTGARKAALEAMKAAATPPAQGEPKQEGAPAGGRERMTAQRAKIMEASTAEKDKFKTALTGILPADKAGPAFDKLGSFSPQWDRYTNSVITCNLTDKRDKVMGICMDYCLEVAKAFENPNMAERGAMTEARQKMAERRKQLDTDLTAVLSPEELVKFRSASPRGVRGPGGQPGGAPVPAPAPAK